MLDYFCIFTKGGSLLWAMTFAAALKGDPVNALIRTCLLEERAGQAAFSYTSPSGGAYTLKWSLNNVGAAVTGSCACLLGRHGLLLCMGMQRWCSHGLPAAPAQSQHPPVHRAGRRPTYPLPPACRAWASCLWPSTSAP